MKKAIYSEKYRRILERLRAARVQAGMTQPEASEALGKYQSYATKCENGDRRIDVLELQEFAELYGKDLSFFVTDDEDLPKRSRTSETFVLRKGETVSVTHHGEEVTVSVRPAPR